MDFIVGKEGHVDYDMVLGMECTHPKVALMGKTEDPEVVSQSTHNECTTARTQLRRSNRVISVPPDCHPLLRSDHLDLEQNRHNPLFLVCRRLHVRVLGVDIQLEMTIDSPKATLEVKRRLSCEMTNFWDQKLKAVRTETNVNGYGVIRVAKFFTKDSWSEGYTFLESSLEHAKKLWPDDHMQFCNLMEKYEKEMKSMSCKMMNLLLQSLGLNDDDIDSDKMVIGKLDELKGTVRFHYYPACPEPGRAMGMPAHTNSSFITILYQSNAIGLQVLAPADGSKPAQWTTFPAINGSLIIIIGDLFQILTNGIFRNGYHQVVVNRSHSRFVVSVFHCAYQGYSEPS